MKTFLFIILASTAASAAKYSPAVESYLESLKQVIVDSTAVRIQAASENNFAKACNTKNFSEGSDTQIYYIAFTIFDDKVWAGRLYEKLGPFVARNYEYMYRQNLPKRLHEACISRNQKAIKRILDQMQSISFLEGVGG